ncbi:MAG: hypothetical protein F6K42_14890 [Leptolyngbya sp. SIO1D8]|nr:hypothetical protein [Leptolyngbya sp. SIO1D8]
MVDGEGFIPQHECEAIALRVDELLAAAQEWAEIWESFDQVASRVEAY